MHFGDRKCYVKNTYTISNLPSNILALYTFVLHSKQRLKSKSRFLCFYFILWFNLLSTLALHTNTHAPCSTTLRWHFPLTFSCHFNQADTISQRLQACSWSMYDNTYVGYSGQDTFKIYIACSLDADMSFLLWHCLDTAAKPEKNNEPVCAVISGN